LGGFLYEVWIEYNFTLLYNHKDILFQTSLCILYEKVL